ncbi:MAG: carbohydrate ABC transporter permease [Clostridia bacterium]|nr:carbohydrate ABC transporter permease [Clostridia bacterium]
MYANRYLHLSRFITYFVLIAAGFVYLYPMIYMIICSVMSQSDLVDPSITWVPTGISFENYLTAFETLDFWGSIGNSFLMVIPTAIFQTVSTAMIGYGLARFDFPLKKMWIILVVATFLLPVNITLIPRYVLYNQYGILNTVFPQYLPALFGQGIKSTVFILMYYMVFSSYPKAFDEAASIDGANRFKIFYKIAMPMAKSTSILTILFSVIWYWNETEQSELLFGSTITTLPIQLENFAERYTALYGNNDTFQRLNESVSLAGTFLSIIPMLILYVIFQRQFVESIERSGITGE